jgi:microcystin-dependent protein
MAETVATDFFNKKVKETYKGILHFDSGLQSDKKIVYDGGGTKTSLSLGVDGDGAIINGETLIQNSLIVSNDGFINSNLSVGGDITLQNGGNINNLIIGSNTDSVNIRALSTAEVGKLRIRESTTDYELIFGNPTLSQPNLFSIIVKKDGTNNLYIKNNYTSADINAPLWIDKATGAVNIKNLNVGAIKNIIDSGDGGGGGGTSNANRNYIPPGAIMMFPSMTIPEGWLECNGSEQLISNYRELHGVIQQTYKTNSGLDTTTKFQLPDLRGMFVRGWDNGRGVDVGRNLGTSQDDELKSHAHTWSAGSSDSTGPSPGSAGDIIVNNFTTNSVGGTETRPKNIALVYCIKW